MDNFFIKMFQRREATPAPISAGVPSSTTDNGPEVKGGSFEERIVYARNPEKALSVSAVYRATELRAKTIGQMPVQYQKKDEQGGNFVPWMYGLGKRINYLLQEEPNPLMSGPSLWEQVTINRIMWGNGFVYVERDIFGDPVHFWLAECAGYDYGNDTYNITYFTPYGPVNKVEVPSLDVLHFPNTFRYYNGFWGIPTLKYAAETLSIIKTQKAQSLETAAKGGRMKLIIGEDTTKQVAPISGGLFDKKEMQKYADEINDRIYSKDVTALRALDKVTNISLSASDQQLIEQLALGLDDVARYYATPRPLLMLDTNSHYNDYTNATMEYLQRTIAPLARELEDLFDAKFLTYLDFGKRRFHMCELPLLRMDLEKQAKVDQLRLQMGWTVNEIRNQYDMPAIEKGDIPYVSTNLAELGSEKLSGAVQPGRPTESKPQDGNQPNSNE